MNIAAVMSLHNIAELRVTAIYFQCSLTLCNVALDTKCKRFPAFF